MNAELRDLTITCVACKAAFTHTAGAQRFFAEKGYTNQPKRCMSCRAGRRVKPERIQAPIVCTDCGAAATVPFQPTTGKPVYCGVCFQQRKAPASPAGGAA